MKVQITKLLHDRRNNISKVILAIGESRATVRMFIRSQENIAYGNEMERLMMLNNFDIHQVERDIMNVVQRRLSAS